MTQWLCKKNFS